MEQSKIIDTFDTYQTLMCFCRPNFQTNIMFGTRSTGRGNLNRWFLARRKASQNFSRCIGKFTTEMHINNCRMI